MRTLVQIKSLASKECAKQKSMYNSCDECPIYNLFGRSGSCEYRLYDGQYRPEVKKVINQLVENWKNSSN